MPKITAVTLYKHGLGHFERTGNVGSTLTLTFPRRAMDDVLKSLTVLPAKGAVVTAVAFETPDDRNEQARRKPITIDATAPLTAVLAAFAGYAVRIVTADRTLQGTLIGLESETEHHLKRGVVAVAAERGIELVPLAAVKSIALDDVTARDDLAFALGQHRRDEERARARIVFSGPTVATVSYIAPAPAWRVSYRVLVDAADGDDGARSVTLQGWGLFDNTLDEDLDGISLTLTAGMPVSFRYALHQPHTPERPLVQDDERTVSQPLSYDSMPQPAAAHAALSAGNADTMMAAAAPVMLAHAKMRMSGAVVMEAAPTQAAGSARGALFAYTVATPVTVRRGESGMVPIIAVTTRGVRDLLFNSAKQPQHPAASVRFTIDGAMTLERGPAVVLDQGHYGGEAVVPFTAGGEVILAYALELGIRMRTETSSREETVKLAFRDRSVIIDTIVYTTTSYEATSTLATSALIVVEHDRPQDHAFVTEPFEQTASAGRFRLRVPARNNATVAVTTRQMRQRYQSMTGITGDAVQRYLRDKLLDRATADALARLRADDAAIAALDTERKALAGDVQATRQRLDDCRKSLVALTADAEAGLRARFATQLEAHDQTLQALDRRDRELIATAVDGKARLEAAMHALGTSAG